MRNRILTALPVFGMIGAGLFGAAPANAAPGSAPAAAHKAAPFMAAHYDCTVIVCYLNWQNCPTVDPSTGAVGVEVVHRPSTSGASGQVIRVRYTTSSPNSYSVDWADKISGGGGTTYWYRSAPIGSTRVTSATGTNWEQHDLAWASYSVNPVVRTEFNPDQAGGDTLCNVNLNTVYRVTSP